MSKRSLNDLIFVIPARAGSIRVPNKNFRSFGGAPLFHWSVQFALQCAPNQPVYVSTDNTDLLSGRLSSGGASVVQRAASVSSSSAKTELWLADFILRMKITNSGVVVLQPTSPLRNEDTFHRVVNKFGEVSSGAVFATTAGSPNGSFYIADPAYILDGGSLTHGQVSKVPGEWDWEALDIDVEADWAAGEELLIQGVCSELHARVLESLR